MNVLNTQNSYTCFRCNSPLLLTSTTTQKLEGSLFSQTTSTYRCANQVCQTEKEKQMEKRMSLIREKELALALREEKKLQAKLALKKSSL